MLQPPDEAVKEGDGGTMGGLPKPSVHEMEKILYVVRIFSVFYSVLNLNIDKVFGYCTLNVEN